VICCAIVVRINWNPFSVIYTCMVGAKAFLLASNVVNIKKRVFDLYVDILSRPELISFAIWSGKT